MTHDTYESPLTARRLFAGDAKLFSPQYKFGLWRRLWLELAQCERELGHWADHRGGMREMEGHLDDIDFKRAAEWEKRLRHDVMAHVHTLKKSPRRPRG